MVIWAKKNDKAAKIDEIILEAYKKKTVEYKIY